MVEITVNTWYNRVSDLNQNRLHSKRVSCLDIVLGTLQQLSKARDIQAIQKSIYLTIMAEGPASLTALAKRTGISYKVLLKHCERLANAGWLRLDRVSRRVVPRDTLPTQEEKRLAEIVGKAIETAPYRGEATAKAMVSWIVAARVRILFNARLAHLRNQTTGQLLEYDIYVEKANWAAEFNGDQHFGPTKLYPETDEFIKRIQRDIEKQRLSEKNGTKLSIITKEDLALGIIDSKIPSEIPRRVIGADSPMTQMLQKFGRQMATVRSHRDRE